MLNAIFAPRSIAVIGASPDERKLGHTVFKNIVVNGFPGALYPIHPTAGNVLEHKAYPSVTELPETPDLAVIVVPPQAVLAVVEECGQKGVQGLVVITAGFKEVGGEGRKLERKLLEIVRRYDMRMVGPNCLGVIDTYHHTQRLVRGADARGRPDRVYVAIRRDVHRDPGLEQGRGDRLLALRSAWATRPMSTRWRCCKPGATIRERA